MTEELQELIERIQKEGVEKAERQAQDVLSRATEKAAKTIADAEATAARLLDKARDDTARMEKSGTTALKQAARDVIISVGKGLESILHTAVATDLDRALETEHLCALLEKLLTSLASRGTTMTDLEVVLGESDYEKIVDHDSNVLADWLREGVTLRSDPTIRKGFRISYEDSHLHHEFTDDAIADALSSLLHPKLARIVAEALDETNLSSPT